jgi:hypothetical protein
MKKLVIDFESYYAPKDKYDLRHISMVEYVSDDRFKAHGLGYMWIGEDGLTSEAAWVSAPNLVEWMASVDWANTIVVAHNAKFDGYILRQIYGAQPAYWIDTKGMSRAVHGKTLRNHSLATIAEHYGLIPKGMMKTEGLYQLTEAQERELAEYCLHDVELCGAIFLELKKAFPKNQYKVLSWTVQTFVDPRLRLNADLLDQTAAKEADRKATIFDEIGIEKPTFSSNAKFAELLKSKGYEVPMKVSAKTGKSIPALALGDVTFLDLLESENEELRTLCEARVAAKSNLLETRSAKMARIARTGAWPFDVEFSGANQTHRFSGGSGAGGNPQNFTRGSALRQAVEAPEGYSLVVGDFAAIECRLVAYLANDGVLIKALEGDPYCDFASFFYGRTITKADETERRFGKCAILGLGYGMGAEKFKRTVRVQTGQTISLDVAEKAVEAYRERYKMVPSLWYRLDAGIKSLAEPGKGYYCNLPVQYEKEALVLPSGLKMRYPHLHRGEDDQWVFEVWGKTKAARQTVTIYGGKVLENICQGLAGELCKEVAARFLPDLTGLVHDEIHLLVPEQDAESAAVHLEEAMTQSPSWLPTMKLKAEVGVGKNWLAAK